MRVTKVFGTLAATTVVAMALTASAQAAPADTCAGTATDITVAGDLVVPAGEACDLSGSTVEGNVTVEAGADLLLDDTTVQGDITVAADGYVDANNAEVVGDLLLTEAFGGYLEESTIVGVASADAAGFLYAIGSQLENDVDSTGGETMVEASTVEGDVTTSGATFTDVIDATLEGSLTIGGAEQGARVCASEVDGDVTITGASELVQVGGDEPLADCGFNALLGDLVIEDNDATAHIGDGFVRGDLVCADNAAAPVVDGMRVRGERSGQCAEGDTLAMQRSAAPRALSFEAPDRGERLSDRAEDRRAAAAQAAAAAGVADLG